MKIKDFKVKGLYMYKDGTIIKVKNDGECVYYSEHIGKWLDVNLNISLLQEDFLEVDAINHLYKEISLESIFKLLNKDSKDVYMIENDELIKIEIINNSLCIKDEILYDLKNETLEIIENFICHENKIKLSQLHNLKFYIKK